MISPEKLALVVDDNPTNRLVASTLLKKLGWSVCEAESGEAALVLTARQPFRVVLLDISMPGLSGEDTCRQIRQQPEGSSMFIVAYTAHAFPEEKGKILAAGFNDILIKPFARAQLEAIIARV